MLRLILCFPWTIPEVFQFLPSVQSLSLVLNFLLDIGPTQRKKIRERKKKKKQRVEQDFYDGQGL